MASSAASSAPSSAFNLLELPAATAPAGTMPDFEHPQTIAPVFLAVGTIFVAFATFFFVLRVYTKLRFIREWRPDDYILSVAYILTICYFITCCFAVTVGHFGTHIWDLRVADLESDPFLLTGYFSNWTTAFTLLFVKLALFLLYLQVFRPFHWLRWALYFGATVNVLFYLSIIIAILYSTTPGPGETFAETIVSPREKITLNLAVPYACGSLVIDVYLLIMPILGVMKLQLSSKRKIGVMLMFAVGSLACVASSLSIYFRTLESNTSGQSDITYDALPVQLTALVEMCVGIMVASMPSFARFNREIPSVYRLLSFAVRRRTGGSRSGNTGQSSHLPLSSKDAASVDNYPLTHELDRLSNISGRPAKLPTSRFRAL